MNMSYPELLDFLEECGGKLSSAHTDKWVSLSVKMAEELCVPHKERPVLVQFEPDSEPEQVDVEAIVRSSDFASYLRLFLLYNLPGEFYNGLPNEVRKPLKPEFASTSEMTEALETTRAMTWEWVNDLQDRLETWLSRFDVWPDHQGAKRWEAAGLAEIRRAGNWVCNWSWCFYWIGDIGRFRAPRVLRNEMKMLVEGLASRGTPKAISLPPLYEEVLAAITPLETGRGRDSFDLGNAVAHLGHAIKDAAGEVGNPEYATERGRANSHAKDIGEGCRGQVSGTEPRSGGLEDERTKASRRSIHIDPEKAQSAGQGKEPEVPAILRGRHAILETLGRETGQNEWESIKRLNKLREGPIVCPGPGKRPFVMKDALARWWNEMHRAAEDAAARQAERDRDIEASRSHIEDGVMRGRGSGHPDSGDLAAGDDGMSLRDTRRTHMKKPATCPVCGHRAVHAGKVCGNCGGLEKT